MKPMTKSTGSPEHEGIRHESQGLRLFGHPVHPWTVHLPIGLLLGATALDILKFFDIKPAWELAGRLALIGGLCSGLVAVLSGFIDFLSLAKRAEVERAAQTHLSLVMSALTLYGVSLWWRLTQPENGMAALLSVGGALALVGAGWFGAQLVYHFGQGVHVERPAPHGDPRS